MGQGHAHILVDAVCYYCLWSTFPSQYPISAPVLILSTWCSVQFVFLLMKLKFNAMAKTKEVNIWKGVSNNE